MTLAPTLPVKAVVFDAYATLFDVYSVDTLAESYFPGQGSALAMLWRQKQIEYTRLRSLCGQYVSFWDLTADALRYAARALQLDINADQHHRLMNQYACLRPFPENQAALEAIQALGLPCVILSNGTHSLIDIALRYNDMGHLFDRILSADQVRTFKTAPQVYQLAVDTLGLPAEEILFVSGNSWDACAATWFGYTTFWINRNGAPSEELGVSPTATGSSMADVVAWLSEARDTAIA